MRLHPSPFSPCKSKEIAVGCTVLIPSTKPVARAPPSAASRALQRLRMGVGEAQPGAAGLLGVAPRAPHPGRRSVSSPSAGESRGREPLLSPLQVCDEKGTWSVAFVGSAVLGTENLGAWELRTGPGTPMGKTHQWWGAKWEP